MGAYFLIKSPIGSRGIPLMFGSVANTSIFSDH